MIKIILWAWHNNVSFKPCIYFYFLILYINLCHCTKWSWLDTMLTFSFSINARNNQKALCVRFLNYLLSFQVLFVVGDFTPFCHVWAKKAVACGSYQPCIYFYLVVICNKWIPSNLKMPLLFCANGCNSNFHVINQTRFIKAKQATLRIDRKIGWLPTPLI